MSTPDLIKMLSNLGNSLFSVQYLLSGFAYVIGIIFIYVGLSKLKVIGSSRPNSPSQVRMIVPIAYFLAGAAIIFIPTMVDTARNTFFGNSNILGYSSYEATDFNNVFYWLIKTVGILWFIRGCVLLAHSSNPGFKFGAKGLIFVIAGILAMNIENTQQFLQFVVDRIIGASGTSG